MPSSQQFDAAEMIRGNLHAAGIPYSVPGPDGPEYADFHALRHSFLTLLGRSGVGLRTAQVLAGHSTSSLTERYTHTRLHDQQQAVNKLPALTVTPGAIPADVELRATGTDNPAVCRRAGQTRADSDTV